MQLELFDREGDGQIALEDISALIMSVPKIKGGR